MKENYKAWDVDIKDFYNQETEKDKLRFHELITAFEQRGIFVDKQTEQELIKFYERIGNVERMSDSGDAVYVRKTI